MKKETTIDGINYFINGLSDEISAEILKQTWQFKFPHRKWIVLTDNKVNLYNKKYVRSDLHWYIKNVLRYFPQPTEEEVNRGIIWSIKESCSDNYNYYSVQSHEYGRYTSYFVYQDDNHKEPKTILTKSSTVFEEVLITVDELCALYENTISKATLRKEKKEELHDKIMMFFNIYDNMSVTWEGVNDRKACDYPEIKQWAVDRIMECDNKDLLEVYQMVGQTKGSNRREHILELLNTKDGFVV